MLSMDHAVHATNYGLGMFVSHTVDTIPAITNLPGYGGLVLSEADMKFSFSSSAQYSLVFPFDKSSHLCDFCLRRLDALEALSPFHLCIQLLPGCNDNSILGLSDTSKTCLESSNTRI